jgi:hypothetical protein
MTGSFFFILAVVVFVLFLVLLSLTRIPPTHNLQRTLERLGNLMSVIQKAPGGCLERQRREFSWFLLSWSC